MVTRVVVGAHYGLRDWLVQRLTAVVMVAYVLFLAAAFFAGVRNFETWRTLMADGFVRAFSFVFMLALCWHAWIGVRDIWMDYVKPPGLRLLLHFATATALVGYVGWAVQVIWRL